MIWAKENICWTSKILQDTNEVWLVGLQKGYWTSQAFRNPGFTHGNILKVSY